jgi:hypothetical protein
MATLNELGRNSSSVTYGPYATGQDLFPTLQAVDTWFRNDTWQGTATAASTTLTGTGTIWTTQARAGDYIIVAGQQRIVAAVASDTSMTVTVAFSPAITIASAVRVVSSVQPTQTAGYVSYIARGDCNGVVSTTAGSATITGVGTYFLAEATNSVALTSMTGTVAIATDGTITGTSTVFQTGAPTNNSLYPGDSIAVTVNGAIFYFEIASVSSDTAAVVANLPSVAISGATISKATNGVTGRSIQINGRTRTITAISSNTSMTVNFAMDFTDSNMKYKVYPRGTISNASAANGTLYGTTSATASNSTTLAIAGTITGQIMPGCLIYGAVGTIPANTVITNQQFASGAATVSTASTGTIGQNTLTVTSATSIAVGQIVQGNGAALAGIPAGTYVVSISGTSVVISQNLAAGWTNTTVYFYTPGGAGTYTTSNATTLSAAQIYFSTLQATGANFFWGLGVNNLVSTTYTPFMYQTSQLDQVWFGDEVRTLNFSTYSGALTTTNTLYGYTTDYTGFSGTAVGAVRQLMYLQPFRREDSYINMNVYGTAAAVLSDLRVGDDLIIDGTEVTVTALVSNTQFKVDKDFTHTTAFNSGAGATATTTQASGGAVAATTFVVTSASNITIGQLVTGVGLLQGTYVTNISSTTVTVSNAFIVAASGTYRFYNGTSFYKKLKLHGYTLEGTREGGIGFNAPTSQMPVYTTSATGSTTNLTVAATLTGTILPGMQILPTGATGIYAPTTTVSGLTYITNQQYSTGSPTINNTATAGVVGTNILTTSGTQTGVITVGMIVTGNNAAITGIPPSTYVLNITGTSPNFTITLSNNITTGFVTGTVYFIAPGGIGVYTTSSATTISATNLGFIMPQTGKFTQSTTMFATAGTSYPIGTQSIVVATAPTIGQYNFVKISGAGGPAIPLSGQVTYISTFVNGANTAFTTQLHIGAEIVVGGQYLTVVNIVSDTQLIVAQTAGNFPIQFLTPIYRSVPLYTYALSTSTTTINLANPIENNLYSTQANPPMVYFPSTGCDFLEYVYSAPNYSAEQGTVTLRNQSLDRKYVGFRIWPLFQSTNAVPTNTAAIASAFGAYATPVYERWAASYGLSHGVGINQADLSGGTMSWGYQSTTTQTTIMPVAGSLNLQMGIQGLATGYPNPATAVTASTVMGSANSSYTVTTATIGAIGTPAPIAASLYGVYDITAMTQISGGTLFLFGTNRYLAIQGRSSANIQTQWVGCLEFERAQPEDASTGLGSTSGVTFGGTQYGGLQLAQGSAPPLTSGFPGFNQTIQFTSGVAPWPCFAYFNGNRMPTGAQQIPTVPNLGTTAYPVHGCVLSCPRVRNSAGDLVGFNAHIYSALTVTTGRWGHIMEIGNYGTYTPAFNNANVTATSNTLTNIANAIPQIHMGQIIPVYTNVYNSKRFMFSPVVVLGPAYDPDVRGRIYGLKVLPSALGTLMDTVSITTDGSYFYNTSFSAVDHWVLTTPPAAVVYASALPGQSTVVTNRWTLTQNTPQIQQSWRSLEDTGTQASSTSTTFTNNFRFALPA